MSDGTIYMPPGVGTTLGLVTGDGSNVNDIRFSDNILHLTKRIEGWIINNYPQVYENAGQLGYHFKEPISFVLSATQPGVYWDILEPNSHFRFRIWQDEVCKADSDNAASSV